MNLTSQKRPSWWRLGGAVVAVATLLSSIFLPSSALAQGGGGTGAITGRVMNKASGEYLRSATVAVTGTTITAVAGDGGYYRLNNVPAGAIELTVSYTGLDAAKLAVTVVAGETLTQDVALTSASYDQETITLGTFVVDEKREGNAKAIMDQRVAVNMKKVIAADAMGNVSEGNVGEFLKLMPGVAMDYVEADTRAMRVRGLNPKYSIVMIDGLQPASAGSSNVGTGRAFEFEQLSISSIETVELTKAPTPDQPSAVAGVVNLRSKSAFDRSGRHISFMAGLSANSYYLDLEKTPGWDDQSHFKMLPNYDLEFSDVFLDGKLGIIAGTSRSYTIAAQKHIWNFGPTWNGTASDNDTEVPIVNRWWFQDGPKPTERGNYNIRVDYRLSDSLRAYARLDYTTYDARFYNRTMNLFASTYAPGATFTDMTVTSGRIQTDSNQFMTKEGNTVILGSGVTYEKGTFSADLGLQYSRARNWYGNIGYGHFTDFASQLPNISWRMTRSDRGSSDITFTQLTGADWRNPANYTFVANSLGWHERASKDQRWTARIDLKNDLSGWSVPQVIKYGASTSLQVFDVRRAGLLTVNPTGVDGIFGNADDPKPSDFVDTPFRTDWDAGGNMNNWFALSPWKLYSRFVSNPTEFRENTAANNLARLRGNWDFKEQIDSVYLVDTFTFGKFTVSPGVRYEATTSSGKGINTVSNTSIRGGNDYDDLLKYVHASYDVNKNFKLRASFHTAITRGDIANLIPGISGVDFTNAVLTATNPDLKPEKSKTFNVSAEYYFEPIGVITASAFKTDVKDRQFANRSQLTASGYEGDTTYANWTLASPVNIGYSTGYSGVELDYQQQLSFLPGAFSGIGVFANQTWVKYDDWAFNTGSPKDMTNAGISYRYKKFFGRLNFNHVGKLLQNPQRTYSAATNTWTVPVAPPIYQKDRLVTDLNLEFRATKNITVFFDARNLLNEESVYTYFGREENFERILKTGAIMMLGVKGRF